MTARAATANKGLIVDKLGLLQSREKDI